MYDIMKKTEGKTMAENVYVTEKEFSLATKRIDDENHRQNERIQALENNMLL